MIKMHKVTPQKRIESKIDIHTHTGIHIARNRKPTPWTQSVVQYNTETQRSIHQFQMQQSIEQKIKQNESSYRFKSDWKGGK